MEALEGIRPISLSQVVRGRYNAGRIAVPVKPSQSIYAHFKHVVGIREYSEGGGVSLSKLRMLDTLIDQLKRLKGERAYVRDVSGMSQESLEKVVEQYQKELNRIIKARQAAANTSSTGWLVNQFA